MAERKISVRNFSIILHVAHIPQCNDEGGKRSAERANAEADNLSHVLMDALAHEGYKFPEMKYEVLKCE